MDEQIIKYCTGELNQAEETVLLEEAFRNPELKQRIIEYSHLHSLMGLQEEGIDLPMGRMKYAQFKRMLFWRKQKRVLSFTLRYAAVFIVGIFCAWVANSYLQPEESVIAQTQELYVPAGQRAQLTLPDGSKAWLNACSRLTYSSVFGKERRVHLVGEGYFEVAKNPDAPFIVSTRTLDVKALGTQFNVRSYPTTDETQVYLHEGSVRTYLSDNEAKGMTLKPGQMVVERNKKMTLTKMDADELLWREGIYVFKKERMGEIIAKLQLYFDVKITVRNPEILNYRYVGKFRQRDGVITILRVMQKIHHFRIEQNEENNEIILSK